MTGVTTEVLKERSQENLQETIKATMSLTDQKNQSNPTKINNQLTFFHDNNLFLETFSMYYICKIWNLWEMVITETPILVYSEKPSICR